MSQFVTIHGPNILLVRSHHELLRVARRIRGNRECLFLMNLRCTAPFIDSNSRRKVPFWNRRTVSEYTVSIKLIAGN